MKSGQLLWEITTWEFWRWFKLKDQIWTLVLSLLIGTAVWGGRAWLDRRAQAPVTLAVVNADELVSMFPEESRIRPRPSTAQVMDDLMLQLEREEIDGVLVFANPDSAQLTVRNRPSWAADLTESLSEIRVAQRLNDARLEPELVASMLAPVSIQIDLTQGRNASRSQAITAAVLVSLMTLGVVLGLSYQFIAITGEKQLRVTEQIISAVSPQMWIDGKVLGVSLLSLASTLNLLASLVFFLWVVVLNPIADRLMCVTIGWLLRRTTSLGLSGPTMLLQVTGGYSIAEHGVLGENGVVGGTLSQLQLPEQGFVVLGVKSHHGRYTSLPDPATQLVAGDVLVLYGDEEQHAALYDEAFNPARVGGSPS